MKKSATLEVKTNNTVVTPAKFADAMGLGDNLAFAGVGNVNKTLNKVDDALGRTVARVEGAVEGATQIVTAEVGQVVDRYGFNPESGQFFGKVGDSFESRALPPSNNPKYGGAQYTQYEVLKPFEWEKGEIAPWFNQPGGGKQWYVDVEKGAKILNDDGEKIPATLENLYKNGYIKIINK